ncbi:HD domain-containing protein [Cytobacillus sp. IB215665]|uniref:HD domain-containing protein n=1 Tax=Cytobacillus sp. IB215665 TaxID=3097357 RepID=UPI002A11696B|nr:HD domain-containing protein [Cytobacillus sp. IB215665]MDX8366532.1 HD domain-containing protein [Cytobacillus sp. IB215665]
MHAEMIKITEQFVKSILVDDRTGHDYFHIHRVRNMALRIGKIEKANLLIVEMAALLHDTIDDKIMDDPKAAIKHVTSFMHSNGVRSVDSEHIMDIITSLSFKGGNGVPMKSLEGQVVQDADRLDALGAIGIARAFTYGGLKGHILYDPDIPIRESMTYEQYRFEQGTTINHFYEKLLRLSDKMNTEEGKKIAHQRHGFIEKYLKQFFEEWNGQL